MPFGVNLMRSEVLYRAAQDCFTLLPSCLQLYISCSSVDSLCVTVSHMYGCCRNQAIAWKANDNMDNWNVDASASLAPASPTNMFARSQVDFRQQLHMSEDFLKHELGLNTPVLYQSQVIVHCTLCILHAAQLAVFIDLLQAI